MRPVRALLALTSLLVLVGSVPRPALATGDPFLRRTATVRAVERVGPSVVNITTEQRVQTRSPFQPFLGAPGFDQFFRDFFEPGRQSQRSSLGSGVVIDPEGHVLTNEHVVAAADSIRITLADGREFEARLVGADPNNDLAVLQLVEAKDVPWTQPGTSKDLMVGEPVIAIGNPFGLSNTVTTGVLSALDRSIRSDDRVFHGFLQTDASINPGNSGGPLLNAAGDLVGVNTAIYQGAEGIGFAIPIDVAGRIVRELITHGELAPVWLGLDLQDLDGRLVELMNLPDATSGALASRVRDGSPAALAGVRRGDVVTAVDGHAVRTAREYYEMLERATTGQELALTLQRGERDVTLTARATTFPDGLIEDLGHRLLGVQLAAGPNGGFVVEEVRTAGGAARIGVEPGDLFLSINGRPLADPAALQRAVLDLRGRPRAQVVVQRGRGRYHVTVPLGE
jgi:serine protease Do